MSGNEPSLADERERDDQAATIPLADTPEAAPPRRADAPLVFTGKGSEYFRIWVVNVVLTIVTLGIYSAWAKVRKASYFARNTRLLGDSFDFTANPWAILRGRIVALVLLGFYTFAFDFSLTLGLVSTTVLVAAAPLLFASATRFRLQNTRWRALRFGFMATRREAYGAGLIVVAVWVSGTVIAAFGGLWFGALAGSLAGLLFPWMHHRMKAFQHRHAWFAGNASRFESAVGRFYVTYLVAGLLLGVAGIVAAVVVIALGRVLRQGGNAEIVGVIVAVFTVLLGYLTWWPYFASRIQRIVWERTTLGPFAFKTTIAFRTLLPIAARNIVLFLLSGGLYWPFAAIAWARYRIQCMTIESNVSPDAAVASLDPGASRSTAGEGAVDFFGVDLGW